MDMAFGKLIGCKSLNGGRGEIRTHGVFLLKLLPHNQSAALRRRIIWIVIIRLLGRVLIYHMAGAILKVGIVFRFCVFRVSLLVTWGIFILAIRFILRVIFAVSRVCHLKPRIWGVNKQTI